MKEFLIVSFLKENLPTTFNKRDWPLHVTIVRPFFSEKSSEEVGAVVRDVCSEILSLTLVGKSKEMLGPDNNISVTEVESTVELGSLRNNIIKKIEPFITFKPPLYSTFRPHVTDQRTGSIAIGEKFTIRSLSLVEEHGTERAIVDTCPLQPL